MKNPLLEYFSALTTLSDEETQAIVESMRVRTYEQGTLLLREGEQVVESYFVMQGCVREYCLIGGEEMTTNFFTEGQWVLSLQSLLHRVPANHWLVCAEQTVVVVGTEKGEQELLKQCPRFESIARKVTEYILAEYQERVAAHLTSTPEQRYVRLLQSRPELLQRIPQYQIASYIGVKPESLSRIRKRLALNKKISPTERYQTED
jgi:CRP-like cAMP-binding protein